jgi:hypothetical protein
MEELQKERIELLYKINLLLDSPIEEMKEIKLLIKRIVEINKILFN